MTKTKVKPPLIEIEKFYSRLRIKINGVIHLSLHYSYDTKLSIHTYLAGKDNYYNIDYHVNGDLIETGYTRKDIFDEVLRCLEEKHII